MFQLDTQDKIILQWKSGESATMHILVVHAMVIILSYGLPKGQWLGICSSFSLPVQCRPAEVVCSFSASLLDS